MVAKVVLDPILKRLVAAWHDAEAIRDMPELFSEDKLAQIANATMVAIEEAWLALGHSKRDLEATCESLMASGKLENWAGKKHVRLD